MLAGALTLQAMTTTIEPIIAAVARKSTRRMAGTSASRISRIVYPPAPLIAPIMTAAIGDPTLWKVCGSFLICDEPMAFNDGADMLNQDIPNDQRAAKAKELLKEAGYKGEPVVLLDPANYPTFHAANLVFAEALKRAGVNVQLDTMDWSTLVTRRTKKDPAGQGGWSIFFTSNGGLEGSNPAFNISTSAGCDKAWWGWPCDLFPGSDLSASPTASYGHPLRRHRPPTQTFSSSSGRGRTGRRKRLCVVQPWKFLSHGHVAGHHGWNARSSMEQIIQASSTSSI